MNSHRQAKNEQLFRLASEVTSGVIVELGAYQGEGTVALCKGATVQVYAVDTYNDIIGWAGERYIFRDKKKFTENVNANNVAPILIVQSVSVLSCAWDKGDIGLLIWDLGMKNRLSCDFDDWQDKVTGKFAIHDTDGQRLGSKELNPIGWRKQKDGVFWILQKEQ